MGATGPQGPPGSGVASFDDLAGSTCRAGEPQEGVLEVSYGDGGAVTLTCVAAALQELTVTLAGAGSGTVSSTPAGITCGTDCTESYVRGTSVQLRAIPDSQNLFGGWSGACTGTGLCTVAMNDVRNVTATFHQVAFLTVEVRNTTPSAVGSYGTSVVTGPNNFQCSKQGDGTQACSIAVPANMPVTFTAAPAVGNSFTRWSGGCIHSALQCTFAPPPGGTTLGATFDD